MGRVTQVLRALGEDARGADDELLRLVYSELRMLARREIDGERAGHTLQTTALVHEAYLRLLGGDAAGGWDSRGQFFRAAAEAMRRILVEHARARKRLKRGGDRRRIDIELSDLGVLPRGDDLLALDEAMSRLAEVDPRAASLVELRFFSGVTMPQAAATLGVSVATAERDWAYARAWLHGAMSDAD